ncbi:uncharacterized protein LOC113316815 [Papaver somniferum]|uniref:uncharacterized protein LOC113316815 n=1 Tax=Papaver somniferum TaxID=3469 RepID=UPI000E6FAA4C|nr:uncharacterized protein LOC113316815 [Papaver somniferum]
MTKPQKCSSRWSAMLGCRSEVKEGCCWEVGNGEKMHIKTDPWIPKLHHRRPIPNLHSTEQPVLVSELILQNPPRWDINKLQLCFQSHEVETILDIHLPNISEEGTEDKLLWLHHPNGVFTEKSFIKTLNDITPSSSHYECRMCNGVVETLKHLFLYCPVSQAVLFASHLILRIDASLNLSVHHYIKSWLLEGGDYSKLKMGICLFWSIWKTMNNIVFNKGTVHIQKMLQEAYYWFHRDTNIQDDTTLPSEQDLLDSAETVCTPVEAEAHGALVGIELAISKAMRHIIIEGDSLTVINSLRYNNFPVPWRIKNTIGKIKDKLGKFTFVDFNFIKKEANFMAHSLAAYAV